MGLSDNKEMDCFVATNIYTMGKIVKKDTKTKRVSCNPCNSAGYINGKICPTCKGKGYKTLLTDSTKK